MHSYYKIAFYLANLQEGGAENAMVIIANEFYRRGYEVDFVLANAEGNFLTRLSSKIRIIDLKAPHKYLGLFGLIQYFRATQPNAMLSSLHVNNIYAILAKKISGASEVKIAIRVATIISSQRRVFWKKWLEKLTLSIMYPLADIVVSVSKTVASDLTTFLKIPKQKIITIYNPSITPDMLLNSEKPLNHPWFKQGSPPVVLGVGRLTSDKGYATLIRAFALASKELDMRLLILGDGAERLNLETLARDLEIQEKLEIAGFEKNPFNYMRNAKVMVLPSLWEGLPNVLIEALACGCPVISTDSPGGVREILNDGQYGILVPVNDVIAMSAKILEVLKGNRLLADSQWLEQFKMENSVKQYIEAIMN